MKKDNSSVRRRRKWEEGLLAANGEYIRRIRDQLNRTAEWLSTYISDNNADGLNWTTRLQSNFENSKRPLSEHGVVIYEDEIDALEQSLKEAYKVERKAENEKSSKSRKLEKVDRKMLTLGACDSTREKPYAQQPSGNKQQLGSHDLKECEPSGLHELVNELRERHDLLGKEVEIHKEKLNAILKSELKILLNKLDDNRTEITVRIDFDGTRNQRLLDKDRMALLNFKPGNLPDTFQIETVLNIASALGFAPSKLLRRGSSERRIMSELESKYFKIHAIRQI